MEQVDFTIKRYDDSYHIERLRGEAKIVKPGDDSIPVVKSIGRWVRRDGDENDAGIRDAARRVFDSTCSHAMRKISASGDARCASKPIGHLHFANGTSVTVERYPDLDDGRNLAVTRLGLPVFLDSGEGVDDCDVELLFDLDARQPDSQMCDAIILLVDWMVEETARRMEISQSS